MPPFKSIIPLNKSCNGGVSFNDATAIVAKKGKAAFNRQRKNFSIKKMINSYKYLYMNASSIYT